MKPQSRMRLLTALSAALFAAGAAALPCAPTIPGKWLDGALTHLLVWTARPSFTTTWSSGGAAPWATMNGTFSADYSSVDAHFSNGHHGTGLASPTFCDKIIWNDGTSWLADEPIPLIQVHVSPHTHDDVGELLLAPRLVSLFLILQIYLSKGGGGRYTIHFWRGLLRASATPAPLPLPSPALPSSRAAQDGTRQWTSTALATGLWARAGT